jgi:hypothetical protein
MPAPCGSGCSFHPKLKPFVVYLFVCLANLVFASLCFAAQEESPDLALNGMYVASLVWEVSCLWSWYQVTGRIFDAYTLFATAVWLFHGGGIAVTQLFSADPYAVFQTMRVPVLRSFTDAGVVRAFQLVLFCLSALQLGALLGVGRWHAAGPLTPPSPSSELAPPAPPSEGGDGGVKGLGAAKDFRMGWMGLLLVGVSVVPAMWTIRAGLVMVREGGYMALYDAEVGGGAVDNWYFMFASGLVPGAFYLMSSDLDNRRLGCVAWGLILSFSLGLLALGTRAAFYQNTIALLWLQHHGVRPIRKVVWGMILVSGLFLATLIYWSREYSGRSAMNWSSFEQAGAHAVGNVTEPLTEMGGSILVSIYVLDLVPAERGFGWGESYFHALLSILPGSLVGEYFANREIEENWLIHAVSPETASVGGGLGFSLIAEAYLNFGVGAPAFLALVGIFLGTFTGWVHARGRSGRLAFAACVISVMLFGARASSLAFVRRIITLCVFPYIALSCGQMVDAVQRSRQRTPSP